jgi:HPt (histidine-containing phosphotransfer) domain-containing protein
MQKLQQAVAANDAAEIARAAHSLKSSSANVGAKALSAYYEELETSARRSDTAQARKSLAKIEAEHGRVQTALAEEFELLALSKAEAR